MLVLVGPAPDLDHAFMYATTSSGCSSAITSVQVITAGMLATCRVQSGYRDRSSIALNLPGRLLEMLEDLALGVDRVDDALLQRGLQRTERQVVLVIPPQPQLGRVVHGIRASRACRTSHPGRGTRRSRRRRVVMPFIRSISSMPCSSWMRHQSFLIVFRLFERPIFLPFRSVIR